MIAATSTSTDAASSRRCATSAPNWRVKSAARASSLTAICRLAHAIEPAANFIGQHFECGTVDDQARGNIRDALDLHEAMRLQRRAAGDQIDDSAAQPQARRQLDPAVQLDA